MGVGLVKSLQPPDILLIHCNNKLEIYNYIADTSEGALFLPPPDVYVRSFLYLFYTVIKLYYTKALSSQALSLAQIEFFSSGGQESQHLLWFSNNISTTKRSNQSNLKEISPEYSLGGLMLKLKLQYFGHLM